MAPQSPYFRKRFDHDHHLKKEPKLCTACDKVFPGRADLLLHLQETWLRDQTSLHHCHMCAVVFNNDEQRSEHIRQNHAAQEKLICPACRCGPFMMPNHLLAHMKQDSCPAYNGEAIARFKTFSESARSSQVPQWNGTSQTNAPEKSQAWTATATRPDNPSQGQTLWSQIQKPRLQWKSCLDAWGKNITRVVIEETSQPSGAEPMPASQPAHEATTAEHDPNSPSFDADRCISKYTGRYTCPQTGCGKTFKSHQLPRFKGHLKSHLVDYSHQCPSCCKRFRSVTELITHMEQREIGCQLQQSADFGEWLLKVTGGIVTCSSKTARGLPIFETSLDAQRD